MCCACAGRYRYETRYLLELAGFKVLSEYSDFKGSAPRYGAEQVWVSRAAAPELRVFRLRVVLRAVIGELHVAR
jgi:hypothetical protein